MTHTVLTRGLVVLALALASAGCLQTPGSGGDSTGGPAVSSTWRTDGDWQLVREQPETYFPAGTDPQQETDFRNGEWVMGGVNDPIFFIPSGGANGKSHLELQSEARAIVGPYEPPQEVATGSGPLAFFRDRDVSPKKEKKKSPRTDYEYAVSQSQFSPADPMSGPSLMGPPELEGPETEMETVELNRDPQTTPSAPQVAEPSSSSSSSSGGRPKAEDFWQPGFF